jgi:hypothetical protein
LRIFNIFYQKILGYTRVKLNLLQVDFGAVKWYDVFVKKGDTTTIQHEDYTKKGIME